MSGDVHSENIAGAGGGVLQFAGACDAAQPWLAESREPVESQSPDVASDEILLHQRAVQLCIADQC